MKNLIVFPVLAASAVLIASCGGGGGASSPPPVTPLQPSLTLVAGTVDDGGIGSADGSGAAARFGASDLALGADGNIYVADRANGTIRRVTPAGVVTTPWGRAGEHASVDGIGTAARFQQPQQIAAAPDGSLYVMDAPSGFGAAVQLRRIAPDGAVTTVLSFPGPSQPGGYQLGAMAIDASARLSFVDSDHCELRRIDLVRQALETLASFPKTSYCTIGEQVRADGDGNLYYVEGEAAGLVPQVLKKRSPAGVVSLAFASPTAVRAFALRRDGSIVFSDGGTMIYTVAPGGAAPRRLSGSVQFSNFYASVDGSADTARFYSVDAMVADAADHILMLEQGSVVRRVDTDGRVTTVAGMPPQAMLYVSGTGEQARIAYASQGPVQLVADAAGNAYFSGDALNLSAIARVTPEGVLSTFAGSATETGNQDGPASEARFRWILAIARDPQGALLVAEAREFTSCGRYAITTRSVLRKVAVDGRVSTLPYTFDGAIGRVAALGGGRLLITGDRFVQGCLTEPKAVEVAANGVETPVAMPPAGPMFGDGTGRTWIITGGAIRQRLPDGSVTLVAGSETEYANRDGVGTDARFAAPSGLDADGTGNLYVADTGNGTVRKIAPDGKVTTMVGRADRHRIVLGALPGGLDHPSAVAVVPGGLLIRSDLALLRASF